MDNEIEQIYKETILDLYRHPLNQGELSLYTHRKKAFNPSCGDEVDLTINVADGKIVDIKHAGTGCAISQAAVSLITDTVKGKTVKDVLLLSENDILTLLNIPLDYTRMKCGMLGLKTIQECLLEQD